MTDRHMNRRPSTRPSPGTKLINIGLSLLAASVVIGMAAGVGDFYSLVTGIPMLILLALIYVARW